MTTSIVITVEIDQFSLVEKIGAFGFITEKNINYFFFSSKHISNIPRELFNMYWLEWLSLTGLFKSDSFPKNIINVANVTKLLASDCNIIDLSRLTWLKNLKELHILTDKEINHSSAKGITITKFFGSNYDSMCIESILNKKLK